MYPFALKAGMIMNLPTEDNDKAFLELLNVSKTDNNQVYSPRRVGPSSLMSSDYDTWVDDDKVNRENLVKRSLEEADRLASERRRRRWWDIFTW